MLHTEGPLLSVDVGARETTTESIDDILEAFVGGRGVATRLAHERIPFDVAPFAAENRLYFTTGPMQHSNMSFTGRMNATAVSPLTDGLLSSNAGGFMSRNFADTGHSAVEIVGESDELLAVHVTDDGVTFEEVPELEGATVPEVNDYMGDEHGLDTDTLAVIGPAGENRVRFASIMTSGERAFGRGGLGAVLGAKNVKAISFEGDSAHEIEIPASQMEIHREAATSDHIMKQQGTTAVTDLANELGAFPTRYFEETSFEHADKINGDRVAEKKYKKGTCSACAFACKLPTKDEESGVETEGPEYETVMAFGGNPMVDDIVDVMKSNKLCDELGMDTISCGDVVSAYLKAEDEFGNADLVHEMVEKIAYREGEGDLLAEGVDRAAGELGVKNWTVKGLEFPAHDGRTLNGQGLSYATANRGADHMYAVFYSYEYPLVGKDKAMNPEGLDGKPPVLVEKENQMALNDSGIVCKFSRDFMTPERYELLFGAAYEDLLAVGARVVELERHFNNQRGFDRADDTLPFEIEGLDEALSAYYDLRGWTDEGVVPDASLSV
ncbi:MULTISPECIES: aldehyde ferredoxin oxidoreductase family protein [unclassified Haladaptatus]|uniref:aldehyde ferredoxin oxidoreductase family protein n=1 Tax=unclassified Haladaptatus TaxID=2622732 RepID=UPI0023E7AA6F|nr:MULTISPECIES: aldehyde ferredoxin oxidoreductase C-terminal domain-containing protein [unclassified Haladaptatus]